MIGPGLQALMAAALVAMLPFAAAAEALRVATWDVGLTRSGAGVLAADLGKAPDPALAGCWR